MGKPADTLLEEEKTIYLKDGFNYEIPGISADVNGNKFSFLLEVYEHIIMRTCMVKKQRSISRCL